MSAKAVILIDRAALILIAFKNFRVSQKDATAYAGSGRRLSTLARNLSITEQNALNELALKGSFWSKFGQSRSYGVVFSFSNREWVNPATFVFILVPSLIAVGDSCSLLRQ